MAEKDGNKGLGAGRDMAKRPLVAQRGVRGAQLRTPRKDGWTEKRRRMFIETLAATCNVSEAARVAGMNQSTAYSLKGRDAGFAREWAKALSIGYAELEALLLRSWLAREPDRMLLARLILMRLLVRLFYGCAASLNAANASGVMVPQTDLSAPAPEQFRDDVAQGRLTTGSAEGQRIVGKMALAGFLAGMAAPEFEEALAVVR